MLRPIECMEPEVLPAAVHLLGSLQSGRDITSVELLSPTLQSMAISLKRIADALDGTALGVDITDSLAGLAQLLRNRI